MTVAARIQARPARDRRVFALAVLALVCTFSWIVVLQPLTGLLGSQSDWRAQARAAVDERRDLVAQEPTFRASLAALDQSPIWAQFRSAEPSRDPAAELERAIQAARAAAGLTIRATERLPAAPAGSLRRYGVTVRATARVVQLSSFVAALRATGSFVRVENLRIAAPIFEGGASSEECDVSMDVVGYVLSVGEAAEA